jgi:acyl phosphate:glycerol-3-phosphate acyltransferase
MRDYIIVALIGYLSGNIQSGYLLGKLVKKVDIRTLGQGNAGASNAVESLGWKFGVVVALIDIIKGIFAVLLVKHLFSVGFNKEGALLLYLAGYFAILGHIYPFFMNFKGGKGTATLIGMLLGMNPVYGIVAMFIIAGVTFASDYIAIGTLSLLFYVLFMTIFKELGAGPIIITILGGLLSLKIHLPNFRRIQNGEETKLSTVLHRKKEPELK